MNTIGVGEIVITKEDKAAVNKVLDSNRLSYGDTTKKFESLFAKMHGCRFGIFTNSGTSSLQIALAAMKEYYKWDEGDEVLASYLVENAQQVFDDNNRSHSSSESI